MAHCDACPVAAGLTCLGESHGPVCGDVRRGRPGRARQLVAIATGHESPLADDETASLMAAVDAEFDRHGTFDRVPVAVGLAIIRCPEKGPPCTPCGSFATCRAGKGHPTTGAVDYATCVACKSNEAELT